MKTITEFLQTANKEKFTELLLKKYSKYLEHYGFNDEESIIPVVGKEIIFIISRKHLMDELINKTDFIKFCRKLQWVPTFTDDNIGHDRLVMIIEPITSSKVKLNNSGYVYHITYKKYYDNILDRGLKCVGHSANEFRIKDEEADNDSSIYNYPGIRNYLKDNNYRTITPRIFLINSDSKENILNIADQLDETYSKHDKMIVLKIDLSKTNIPLYKDNINPKANNCVYTFEDIPKELIEQDKELTKLVQNAEKKIKENFLRNVKEYYPFANIKEDKFIFYNVKGQWNGFFGNLYRIAEHYDIKLNKLGIGETLGEKLSGKEIHFEF